MELSLSVLINSSRPDLDTVMTDVLALRGGGVPQNGELRHNLNNDSSGPLVSNISDSLFF